MSKDRYFLLGWLRNANFGLFWEAKVFNSEKCSLIDFVKAVRKL